MIGIIQIFAIEQQQGYNATTDGRISKIEDRAKEYKMFPSDKWHPLRPVGLDDREIEHIYLLPA